MFQRPSVKIRTITGFFSLHPEDFVVATSESVLEKRVASAARCLREIQDRLEQAGFVVQSIRLATNAFGQWLALDNDDRTADEQLKRLDACLASNDIQACALGPGITAHEIKIGCPKIIAASGRFFCSAALDPTDIAMARIAAGCIRTITTHDPLGNFRFCMAACAVSNIPFFPIATTKATSGHDDTFEFAIGLENGALANELLKECASIANIESIFRQGMNQALLPIQAICQQASTDLKIRFTGIDSSLNPSLEVSGSVAGALEQLVEVSRFGGPGTLAAAAAVTRSLQSLPDIQLAGYCGLMLPLCEDVRLAELAASSCLRIRDLLCISHVCGVGIDTVPIPGDVDDEEVALLLLDVAALAHRWGKSLSCRLFPIPGKSAGELTTFDSPYMVNATILPLS